MAKKYDSFIELVPGYESVINITSDDRNSDFWSRYIVNEDMVKAVELISKSLRPDDPGEDVWHYWIRGTYGTGKTYASIVIKHLLEDDYKSVENFLNKNLLFADVKDKFLSVRKNGHFFVKFRSGECKSLNTSNKLLFQLEKSVREIIEENDELSYTGRNSLIESVQKRVTEFKATLVQKFDNGDFPQLAKYVDFDSFYKEVMSGDVTKCSMAQEILQDMNIGLATDLDTFKEWLKDVYAGNPSLAKTGIFIIWDEFTDYMRENDLDIIQQLSLFAKELNFFIMYVIHINVDSGSEFFSDSMSKATARFHIIDISMNEKTTVKLIGESIVPCDGMKEDWAEQCDALYDTIKGSAHVFFGSPDSDMDAKSIKSIFPIHPMTVNLVSKVAQLAQSNRSIFMFLKSNENDGFCEYCRTNGFDDWKWVTPDYLWDFFFVNNADKKRELTKSANEAIHHYEKMRSLINDDKVLRVFKAAMLLLATIGTGHLLKKSRAAKGIQATEKTLCNCFVGTIPEASVKKCLDLLEAEPLSAIVLAPDKFEGRRIELPYSGSSGELENEIETKRTEFTPAKIMKVDSAFGAVLYKQFIPDDKAVVKRLTVKTCIGDTVQIKNRFIELKKEVERAYYKFGLVIVTVRSKDDVLKNKQTIMDLLAEDETKRIIVAVMHYPLNDETLTDWYTALAQGIIAQRAGNPVNAGTYQAQAEEIVGEWVGAAKGKEIDLYYGNNVSKCYSNSDVIRKYERIVLSIYPAAPEGFIKKTTLYKGSGSNIAYYAAARVTLETKDLANPDQKSFNQQWQDCVELLRDGTENIFCSKRIEDLLSAKSTKIGQGVQQLAVLVNRFMTTGTVQLAELWDKIQQELGYYDTGICCYLIAFVLQLYSGKFTWYDGSNPHKLDENTIKQMVVAMMKGRSAGMRLSSESDIEKRFKSITKRVFGFKDEQVGDIFECRKNLKICISNTGYPIWTLKYLDTLSYSGEKEAVCKIADLYADFILENGDQNQVMQEVIEIVKEKAAIYVNLLKSLYFDKAGLNKGMSNFIYDKAPEAKSACETYDFSIAVLYKMLGKVLEEERWQWREEKVAERSAILALDLILVGEVNKALEGKAESVEKVVSNLSNILDYIRVPGCVYEKNNEQWAHTITLLHDISLNKWVGYDIDTKKAVLSDLQRYIVEAIDNIKNPIGILKTYISEKGFGSFSDAEYEAILNSLSKEPYSQTEDTFKASIKAKISELAYSKSVAEILSIWKQKTGTKDVNEWQQKNMIPAIWVLTNDNGIIGVISNISKNRRIDENVLNNSLYDIKEMDLSILNDKTAVNRKFVENVASDKYFEFLEPHISEIKTRIQNNGFRNINEWYKNIPQIRKIVDKYLEKDLRSEVNDKAVNKVEKMSEKELRTTIARILNNSPEACLIILNE